MQEIGSQKIAFVAGAAGGIGSALCRRLDEAGWRVALVGRTASSLQVISAELRDSQAFVADITNSDEVQATWDAVTAQMGMPTAVAHCVGSILLKPAHLLSDQDWQNTINLNLNSAFYLLRSATKSWSRAPFPGSLVFCSTAAAKLGMANHEAIAAAKAGLEGMIRSAAASYASRGIRVNGVAPGLVETGLAAKIIGNEGALKASLAMHPLRRLGQPAEVASALAWLMDPEQAWVTGQVLGVDGGLGSLKTLVAP
jgi:NAD(P)-dependent dehydrogenase (short-subunit alcohol dehydrogenase family)